MKKLILFIIIFLIVLLIILTTAYVKISDNNIKNSKNNTFNSFFEKYNDKTLYGTEVLTIINKIMDVNEENNYLQEMDKQENITVEIIFIYTNDEGKLVEKKSNLEEIIKAGLNNFITSFSLTEFKMENIEYNSQNRVKNITIKQIEA